MNYLYIFLLFSLSLFSCFKTRQYKEVCNFSQDDIEKYELFAKKNETGNEMIYLEKQKNSIIYYKWDLDKKGPSIFIKELDTLTTTNNVLGKFESKSKTFDIKDYVLYVKQNDKIDTVLMVSANYMDKCNWLAYRNHHYFELLCMDFNKMGWAKFDKKTSIQFGEKLKVVRSLASSLDLEAYMAKLAD